MTTPIATSTSPSISLADLSERERKVLRLLALGYINKEIARELELSQNIVDKILSNSSSHYSLYPKIGVANAKGAVVWYSQQVREAPLGIDGRVKSRLETSQDDAFTVMTAAASVDLQEVREGHGPIPFLTVFITAYVALVVLTFIPIWLQHDTNDVLLGWGHAYAVLPLMAGSYGYWRLRKPGQGASERLNQVLRLLSAGLICWADGAVFTVLYTVLTKSAPLYPSLADVGYLGQAICFAIAFVLWWRDSSRRYGLRSWLWVAIAALTTIGYLTVHYPMRNLWPDLHATPLLPLLELTYTLLDSICLGIAISFLVPAIVRSPASDLQAKLGFITNGMVILFLARSAFGFTVNLPDSHWLRYRNGNGADLLFATAFLLIGTGIVLVSQTTRSGAPSDQAIARRFTIANRWVPALLGLTALGLAIAAAGARAPLRASKITGGQIQMVVDEGRSMRVDVDGRVLSAHETVSQQIPIAVTFRVINNGLDPVTLRTLTVGARGPGVTCRDSNQTKWSAPEVQFPSVTDLTLQPGEVYQYQARRTFHLPGAYFIEPVKQDVDGTWGGIPAFTCYDLQVIEANP